MVWRRGEYSVDFGNTRPLNFINDKTFHAGKNFIFYRNCLTSERNVGALALANFESGKINNFLRVFMSYQGLVIRQPRARGLVQYRRAVLRRSAVRVTARIAAAGSARGQIIRGTAP
jgi:hypothetical protein